MTLLEEDLVTCRKCEVRKVAADFYVHNGRLDFSRCRQCWREWHRQRHAPKLGGDDKPRACDRCGTVFTPKTRRPSKFCSGRCRYRARNESLSALLLASRNDRACLHCAAPMPRTMRADAIFCSARCNHDAHHLQASLHGRTARSGNKPGYLRAAICKRDGWRCGICGKRVNPALEYPHPKCASIDHVVPVCEGGTSEVGNLRLVHLVCNLRRRQFGGNEQLALL